MTKREWNFIALWIGVTLGIILFGLPLQSLATGTAPAAPSAIAGAVAGAHASTGDVSAFGGVGSVGPVAPSQSMSNKAFGGGSTGLTGSADCLQSVGVAFNAVSFTFRDGDCLAKKAAEKYCKTEECKKQIECQDKDLPAYAKKAIGCPAE